MSLAEAEKRIAQALKEKSDKLDLLNLKLEIIPSSIGDLSNLQYLDFRYNNLTELSEEIGSLSNLKAFDISHNQLIKLPKEIGDLSNLQFLNFRYNNLTELSKEIGSLSNLQKLEISFNELIKLPKEIEKLLGLEFLNIRGNQLIELPKGIGEFINLQSLDISGNRLTKLPKEIGNLSNLISFKASINELNELPKEIGSLSKLQSIDILDNQLPYLPKEIGNLLNLKSIRVSLNQLTKLPMEIGNLLNLKSIDIASNQLTELPEEIGSLSNLKILNLTNNKIERLPKDIFNTNMDIYVKETSDSISRGGISIYGNPIKIPPIEIIKQGKKNVQAYFDSLEGSKIPLNEIKVILVGDGASGKTSLTKCLSGNKFDPEESQTHGINITRKKFKHEKQQFSLHFWDFGGQEVMHATHQFFLTKRSLYILVLDGRKDENPEYWLKYIKTFGGESPVVIAINKIDQKHNYQLNTGFLQEKYPNIRGDYRVSCKDGTNINKFLKVILKQADALDMPHTKWAKTWFNVKEHLENLNEPFIDYDNYESICKDKQVKSESQQTTLLDFLNDLGVVVHFEEFDLHHTHVLEPKWITSAVYRIITSKKIENDKGVLKLKLLPTILEPGDEQDYKYPRDKYPYIIELMKKFELCYEIDQEQILIPDLLPIEQPKYTFKKNDSLNFIIEYDFMPRTIMPRFIVKMHEDIHNHYLWRTGVVLKSKIFSAEALVVADEEAKKVYISVNGHDKPDYFAVILHSFREINKSFDGIPPTEKVPMPDNPNITFSFSTLKKMEQAGKTTVWPESSEKEYNIKELLGHIHPPARKTEEEILKTLCELRDKIAEEDKSIIITPDSH
ncbi:MAG: GTP-binding protein [Desulfobacteraceae bacterium]|jgi:internalin A|nr:GTP-binding protein [Desulfobacteraceae bacterium]